MNESDNVLKQEVMTPVVRHDITITMIGIVFLGIYINLVVLSFIITSI